MDNIDNYQVGDLLGRGGFASVYKATCINTGMEVAIKMVDKQQMFRAGMNERVRQEVGIHARLKHPAIVELITFFEDASYVYLVLELCHNGELARYLKNTKHAFTEGEARVIFEQVVSGVKYLHSHAIMHRDLTLANLMITSDKKVKIGDFGLATRIQSASERHVTMCGTPNFISPEVATRSTHGLEADVWGLGCLLFTLLVGRPPFDTAGVRSTLTRVVMADYSLPGHLQLSPEVRDLIHRLLQKNPADRIKLDRIVEHPWLRLQECPPSATAQDSGMFTMTTTNFSSNSNISRPGPRPLAAFPVLTEYSEESPGSQQVAGLTASRPPTPQLASLRHQLASLPSVASQASCRDTVREVSMVSAVSGLTRQVSTPCLQPRDSAQASLRSNYSDPALRPAPGPASVSAHQMSQHSHAPSPRPPSPSSLPPRLSSTRLRPTRQRNKNVMANISNNGEICLEFVKAKRGQELVSEVMRISGDGERIVIYSPAPGTPLGSAPPPIPGTGADSFHSYATLPTKYHKKYQYAARFVNLVKASTPKITLYTSQAKCYLMENDGGDFEAYFYSGTKVTVADGKITIKDQEGVSQVLSYPVCAGGCPAVLSLVVTHASLGHQHCEAVAALLGGTSAALQLPTFPLVLGRKPPAEPAPRPVNTGNNSLEKENRAPDNVVAGMADTLLSKVTALSEQTRQVAVPGVGVASQLGDGTVRVSFSDGAQLLLRPNMDQVEYCPVARGGAWSQHTQADMPPQVRAKLGQVPAVLQHLMAAGNR